MSLAENMQSLFDRRLPAALIGAFVLQTAGALVWAGSAAERITVLERTLAGDQAAIERVAVLEEQVNTIRQSLDRIENKLDRATLHQRAPLQ
ncbi:MAG TPA: hypothetical protein VGT78_07285 [Rhizomicrobium sp.]|nr:hypothetical protein [Rhizomicrobium sp.]